MHEPQVFTRFSGWQVPLAQARFGGQPQSSVQVLHTSWPQPQWSFGSGCQLQPGGGARQRGAAGQVEQVPFTQVWFGAHWPSNAHFGHTSWRWQPQW